MCFEFVGDENWSFAGKHLQPDISDAERSPANLGLDSLKLHVTELSRALANRCQQASLDEQVTDHLRLLDRSVFFESARPVPRARQGISDDIMTSDARAHVNILLLAPQLVGWVRLACLVTALAAGPRHPKLCLALFLVNFALDAADGALARHLKQATAFGAFLDVLIDNASRAALWAGAIDGPASIAVPLLEMTVFACTHAVRSCLLPL